MGNQIGEIDLYRGIILANQTSILFGSDPDISLLGKDGATVGVIEIKGGTDPAGALERYGAVLKSFEEARRMHSNVVTILVSYLTTPEVHARMTNDARLIHFDLNMLLDEGNVFRACMDSISGLL